MKLSYSYPCLLIFKEKHGNRHFHITSEKALHKAFNKICLERAKEGYWYDEETNKKLIEHLTKKRETDKQVTVYSFMYNQSGREYEGWDIKYYEEDEEA